MKRCYHVLFVSRFVGWRKCRTQPGGLELHRRQHHSDRAGRGGSTGA